MMKSGSVAVTGGASGIGRGVVERLASDGFRVAILDRDLDASRAVVVDLGLSEERILAIYVDVTSRASVEEAFVDVVTELGPLDAVVNCAGINGQADFMDLTEAEWDRVIDVNLKGTFLVGQAAGRHMAANQRGAIVNMASVMATLSRGNQAHYGASKAGVKQLTQSMALALAPFQIRVNAIAPGPIQTPLTQSYFVTPASRADYLRRVALGRPGTPRDVAGAAAFLISDDSLWITGATLVVDGGVSVARD